MLLIRIKAFAMNWWQSEEHKKGLRGDAVYGLDLAMVSLMMKCELEKRVYIRVEH